MYGFPDFKVEFAFEQPHDHGEAYGYRQKYLPREIQGLAADGFRFLVFCVLMSGYDFVVALNNFVHDIVP